ncbi:mediator complex subunit 13 C-terminal-domain-containing protein [Peziza echinospora]|nr:mediator complex subunit 13 C-terminal-domain-containing protein [Peziza echinospora]
MESPEACLTNALKIGGLAQIPYHVYIATSRRPNPAYELASRPSTQPLRLGEAHIREKGILGIGDFFTGELWVFDIDAASFHRANSSTGFGLPILPTDGAQGAQHNHFRKLPDFPPAWGLREAREGVFLANQISVKEDAPPGSSGNAIDLTGGDPTLPSPLGPSPTQSDEDTPQVIYRYIITSVLSALSYNLSKSVFGGKRYIPLNIRTLVQVPQKSLPVSASPITGDFPIPSPPSSAGFRSRVNGLESRSGLMMFSLAAYLTSAGTLCIIPSGKKANGVANLASITNQDEELSGNHIAGRDVWIAPWGGIGRISEPVSNDPHSPLAMKEHEKRWADEVRQYLGERGIELTNDDDGWVRIMVWLPNDGQNERLQTLVWPTILCFIRLSEDDIRQPLPSSFTHTSHSGAPQPSIRTTTSADDARLSSQDLDVDLLHASQHSLGDTGSPSLRGLANDNYITITKNNDTGLKWFTNAADPLELAERWKLAAEERKDVLRLRMEEKEKSRQQALEAEALRLRDEEISMREQATPKKETDIKPEGVPLTAVSNSVAGVYSTPPDGQIPGNSSNTDLFAAGMPIEPQSAISLDENSLMGHNLETDWPESGDPMSLDGTDSALKSSAVEDAVLGNLGIDLDNDIFSPKVTDEDFKFFDEPEFRDTLDGGMGLGDLGHFGDSDALNTADLQDMSEGGLMNIGSDTNQLGDLSSLDLEVMDGGMDLSVATPMLTKMDVSATPADQHNTAGMPTNQPSEIEKHVHTPPLSPQRAMRLLLPQYAATKLPVQSTPLDSKTPHAYSSSPSVRYGSDEAESSAAKRRASLYSPLVFLPGIEMADKKYMEGGRFFGPPPEEKADNLDGKLASISLLDSPLKRKSSSKTPTALSHTLTIRDHTSVPRPDLAVEDADMHLGIADDGDEDDSDDDDDDIDSSESDVDEDSDMDYIQPTIITSSPDFKSSGGKRKRALDDDGDLALTESGRGIGSASTPQQINQFTTGESYSANELTPPWEAMIPDPDDFTLVDIFERRCVSAVVSGEPATTRMSDMEYATIGKILVDQVITGTLLASHGPSRLDRPSGEDESEEESRSRRRKLYGENTVQGAVKKIFNDALRCTLENYAAIPDAILEPVPPAPGRPIIRPIAQPRKSGKQPSTGNSNPENSQSTRIFKLSPPHAHVHRGETALEILPVALKFWETFGFGPCSGPKNVISFCLYPAGDAMTVAVDEFMERIGAAYDACRLGSYVRGNLDDVNRGLFAIPLASREPDIDLVMQSIKDACRRLGSSLSNVADELQNIVIYFINPFSKPTALVDICHAFIHLQHVYMNAMVELKNAAPNNIVLRIVPIDFIATIDGLVAPSQAEYVWYALDVYNRCMPTESSSSSSGTSSEEVRNGKVPLFSASSSSASWSSKILMVKVSSSNSASTPSFREKTRKLLEQARYSPSIVLAKPPPKAINFQLTADPMPALLQDGACLHVAYKQSLDERWVVFAWSDNWGEMQMTETYCLGKKGGLTLRPWEEVAREAWRKTVECMRKKNVMWRLCFTKVGGWVDEEEVDLWLQLSNSEQNFHTSLSQISSSSSQSQSSTSLTTSSAFGSPLTFLLTDPSPPLSIVPSLPPILPHNLNPQSSSSLFTPASTPQATSTVSPDPSGSALTPGTAAAQDPASSSTIPPELDPETYLVDYADESWGVLLGHRVPVCQSAVEGRMSLCSGFLVRRGAAESGGAGMGAVGVHLVKDSAAGNGGGRRNAEGVLREVLGQYRGLAALAMGKGVVGENAGWGGGGGSGSGGGGGVAGGRAGLPWHVAVVVKAVEGLEICM